MSCSCHLALRLLHFFVSFPRAWTLLCFGFDRTACVFFVFCFVLFFDHAPPPPPPRFFAFASFLHHDDLLCNSLPCLCFVIFFIIIRVRRQFLCLSLLAVIVAMLLFASFLFALQNHGTHLFEVTWRWPLKVRMQVWWDKKKTPMRLRH